MGIAVSRHSTTGAVEAVFITDGIAKQPTAQDACNIWLNPPIENTLLNNKRRNRANWRAR